MSASPDSLVSGRIHFSCYRWRAPPLLLEAINTKFHKQDTDGQSEQILYQQTQLTQRCFQRKVIVRKDRVYEHSELGLCWLESHNEMPNDPCGKPIGFPALSCSLESLLAVSWIMFPNQLDAKARKLTFTIIENISWFMSWQILNSTPLFRSHLFHSLIFNLACQFTFNHPLFHLSISGVNDCYLINHNGVFVLYCPSHLYIHMPIIHHPSSISLTDCKLRWD